jgi:hypothetical protein
VHACQPLAGCNECALVPVQAANSPGHRQTKGGRRRTRAYLRRNLTFPLDVEPWGGRRCAALPRYVECPATTVAYAIPTLGPGAAVRPKSPCASCAALLQQTAPRRAICGSDRPFSALRDHFVRDFQQPASECESDALLQHVRMWQRPPAAGPGRRHAPSARRADHGRSGCLGRAV